MMAMYKLFSLDDAPRGVKPVGLSFERNSAGGVDDFHGYEGHAAV